jgi:hypothetical protein
MAHNAQHLNSKAVYLALTDPNTFATVVHTILLSAYGPDIYETDPIDLYMRLEEDFGAKPIEEVENRIQAVMMATSTDLFFQDPHAFSAIVESLANGDPGIDVLEPLTLPEILWAIYEVELNHGPGKMEPHVEKLIQQAMDEEGEDMEGSETNPLDYLQNYLEEQRSALRHQLEAIGAKAPALPPIHAPDLPSAMDDHCVL